MTRAIDHEHTFVRRVHQVRDVGVDAHVASEPVGDQIGAGPIPGLPQLCELEVGAHTLRGSFVGIEVEKILQN